MYLVVKGLGTERVPRQGILGSFDDFDLGGLHPQVALLGANAAVASADRLDLREVHFVHKGTAVAVATIGLKGFVCVGHGCGFADDRARRERRS